MVYPRNVPESLVKSFTENGYWLEKTLFDFLADTASKSPDDIAIRHGNSSYTFSDFKRISMHLASQLRRTGIGKGDLVSVQLQNCPAFMFLKVALSIIGAIINPIHLVYRKRDTFSMLNFCGSKLFLFPSRFMNRDFIEEYSDIYDNVPSLENISILDLPHDGIVSLKHIPFGRLTDNNNGADSVVPCTTADDIFYLNFTSGTEGDPKGFLHTFNTFLSPTYGNSMDFKLSKDDTLLTLSPMTHSFGHMITYYCAMAGSKVVIVEKYDPLEVLKAIESENVTFLQGTPAHLYGLLNHGDFSNFKIDSVRIVMTGGSLVPKDLLYKVRGKLGAEIINCYGMGENIIHTKTRVEDPDWAKIETVGKPFWGSEVRIFEQDPPSSKDGMTVGEIGYRGPNLFIEYFRNPTRTDETRDRDGWFLTGDIGYLDEHGYLRVTGRKKDIINRGGTKIYPGEVEDLLRRHPNIRDVSIVGMSDNVLGERSCAFVIPRTGYDPVTVEEIQGFLRSLNVTPYKLPERVEIVNDFPMTPTGKVRKEDLRIRINKLIALGRES